MGEESQLFHLFELTFHLQGARRWSVFCFLSRLEHAKISVLSHGCEDGVYVLRIRSLSMFFCSRNILHAYSRIQG